MGVSKTAAKGLEGGKRICILVRGQAWTAPDWHEACKSTQHGHMSRAKVEAMVADGKMEYLPGVEVADGSEQPVWIPVASFVMPRVWRKRMSLGFGAPVATMQLVP